ncbi:hypothetical protein QFC19_007860 [Naganishia cerealis]|uniref:Uncharacterized protein n=1 Tax=Naganishia cerealis TaxID=610337 RepID=A0ACC2V6M8_9TREE|nr:hypothetical protein QFC19_007860 [Naganishia cerealis]
MSPPPVLVRYVAHSSATCCPFRRKEARSKLPDTTAGLRIVLDNLINIESKAAPSFQNMVKALDMAKKFDMKSVVIQIKAKLHGYVEGPRLLALACQQVPIDRHLARTASSQFKNFMNLDPDLFQVGLAYGVPDQTNMKTESLESLTTIGCYALSKAMRECELLVKDIYGRKEYEWARVPNEFMKALDHLER